ncbi:MAG: hypothetical protein HQM08_11830 [Candidatus Riflebacteria bacterium]|nr:hypothetical protein [Candidatus Riflebacteria bacterium]
MHSESWEIKTSGLDKRSVGLKFLARTAIFVSFVFVFIGVGFCSDKFNPEPIAVYEGKDAPFWQRVEHLRDMHPGFVQENFFKFGTQTNEKIKSWFGGNATPHSGEFLLHCAKDFNAKTFPIPVLLLPGSCDNANRGWIHPKKLDFDGSLSDLSNEEKGFAVWLAEMGYSVFAITFAHPQGDNFMQSEHVANAITRIRILLNRQNDPNFKINIIAHSKANLAARLYLSDSASLFPKKKFLTNFRHDVANYIAVASPFRGLDTPFRYYGYNLSLAGQLLPNPQLNAPVASEKMLMYGLWADYSEISVFPDVGKNYFPGQCQLLYNLAGDGILPLGLDSCTTDMNYSMNCLYFGGTSLLLQSRGIKKAIELGERFIYKLEEKGIDPSVNLGVIAGNNPFITKIEGQIVPMPWEFFTPEGDGLLPIVSSTFTDNVLKRGAKLLGKKIFRLNHLELTQEKTVLDLIDSWFMQNNGTSHRTVRAPAISPITSQ